MQGRLKIACDICVLFYTGHLLYKYNLHMIKSNPHWSKICITTCKRQLLKKAISFNTILYFILVKGIAKSSTYIIFIYK